MTFLQKERWSEAFGCIGLGGGAKFQSFFCPVPRSAFLEASPARHASRRFPPHCRRHPGRPGWLPARLPSWRSSGGWGVAPRYRYAEGNIALLPELVAELVRSQVDIIVAATTGHAGVLVAKHAITTIPLL